MRFFLIADNSQSIGVSDWRWPIHSGLRHCNDTVMHPIPKRMGERNHARGRGGQAITEPSNEMEPGAGEGWWW